MTKNLIKNFAGAGYREAAIAREQLGDEGFRTKIIDDGKAMLRTKGGMPRVIPLSRPVALPCMDTLSPLAETTSADREYWEPSGTDPDERVFSLDGLLSLPKRVVKTIKTTSSGASARTVSIRFAHEGTPAVVRPGDMVEESRTLGTRSIPAWFNCGLAFVSTTCVESVKLNMGNCPITLNFKTKLTAPSGSHSGIVGAYDSTSLDPLVFGASSLDFTFSGKRLSINLEAGQTFLEPYSYKVALGLRGGELLPSNVAGDTMVGAFFSMDKWGSPFKYFAHSTGLYVDENRAVKITKPDPKTFGSAADENSPARYFRFSDKDDVQIEGTDVFVKHDIQFNGGYSYPGSAYADTGAVYLAPSEHLYRDSTGAVWRIRFSMTQISEHVVSVTARLIERVDTFLDDADALVVARDLITQEFAPMVADSYPSAPNFSGMCVDSLPNGTEASIAINAPQGDDIMAPRDLEVSRILRCVFSGNGGATGAGISMTFEQLRTVTRYQAGSWRAPTAFVPYAGVVVENTVPSICCPRQSMRYDALGNETGFADLDPVCISPENPANVYGGVDVLGFSPDFITRFTAPYTNASEYNWFTNVNIQLIARSNNTWDMVTMEYTETSSQKRTASLALDQYTGVFYYCAVMTALRFDLAHNQGTWPFERTERRNNGTYDHHIGPLLRCSVKYSCGEQSITGFTEYISGEEVKHSQWTGSGAFTPADELYPAFTSAMSDELTITASMKTPFQNKSATIHRLETAHCSQSNAPYDGNRNYVDSGYTHSGDPDTELFWMNISPRYVAGNKHTIEYNAQDGFVVPPHNTDELIHGIAVLNRPATGYKACDDPRNTRIVLLPTADAGLFF